MEGEPSEQNDEDQIEDIENELLDGDIPLNQSEIGTDGSKSNRDEESKTVMMRGALEICEGQNFEGGGQGNQRNGHNFEEEIADSEVVVGE